MSIRLLSLLVICALTACGKKDIAPEVRSVYFFEKNTAERNKTRLDCAKLTNQKAHQGCENARLADVNISTGHETQIDGTVKVIARPRITFN